MPDLDQPYLDAWRALLNAHAATVARVEEALDAEGLPPLGWYDVLWPLYRAPSRALRAGELSEQVVTISRSGLTRLVDRMEAAGLLERCDAPGDRRGVVVALLPAGSRLLRRMWPVYAAVLRERFAAALGEDEARALAAALGRVHERARSALGG